MTIFAVPIAATNSFSWIDCLGKAAGEVVSVATVAKKAYIEILEVDARYKVIDISHLEVSEGRKM